MEWRSESEGVERWRGGVNGGEGGTKGRGSEERVKDGEGIEG